MEAAGALCVALATLLALYQAARRMPTRAWGEPRPRPGRPRLAGAAAVVALQGLAAHATAGWLAGGALVLASWMLAGWLLVLAMNRWPAACRRWALWLGAAGTLGCALRVAVMGLGG